MGLIGFIDDYLKVVKKIERGLIARYKIAGQVTLGCLISLWIFPNTRIHRIQYKDYRPFFKNVEIDFGMLYPIMVVLVITGTSNAVNLTMD